MIRLSPFSGLIDAYPIMEHTVRFPAIGNEWRQLFEQDPFVKDIFISIRNQNGIYEISRRDVFVEAEVRRKVVKVLIWGFPNGFRGHQNLVRILSNMDEIVRILEHPQTRYTKKQMCELFRDLTSIPGVGFSTATKLLYFFDLMVGDYHAVIVDSNVLKAIPYVGEMRNCPIDYSPESYCKQISYINKISTRLGVSSPDKLEYFLFNFGKSI